MKDTFSPNDVLVSTKEPTPTGIPQRLAILFGHYDLRVFVTDKSYVDVGRGSLEAVRRINYAMPDFSGCIGEVGQFCNFSLSCELLGGGEHRNDMPINIVFVGIPVFAVSAELCNISPLSPAPQVQFKIGNGVVFSSGTKVLSGAKIGDGALIAAGGIVSGTISPFSIAGGVSAKHIKYRLNESMRKAIERVRWWDFDILYMQKNLDRLQVLAVDVNAQHVYRKPSPRFIIKNESDGQKTYAKVTGFIENGEEKEISEAPQRVIDYVNQLDKDNDYLWSPDIWNM